MIVVLTNHAKAFISSNSLQSFLKERAPSKVLSVESPGVRASGGLGDHHRFAASATPARSHHKRLSAGSSNVQFSLNISSDQSPQQPTVSLAAHPTLFSGVLFCRQRSTGLSEVINARNPDEMPQHAFMPPNDY
jgi:hypothetical protein